MSPELGAASHRLVLRRIVSDVWGWVLHAGIPKLQTLHHQSGPAARASEEERINSLLMQNKRAQERVGGLATNMRDEASCSGQGWPGTRNEGERSELSNLWGNWGRIFRSASADTDGTWHHHVETAAWCLQWMSVVVIVTSDLLLFHINHCNGWSQTPDWAPPGAQWGRHGDWERVWPGESTMLGSVMSSHFYEKFKRAHDEIISSHQSQLMITQMKEGIWCQFTYFTTTVFVIFLVQFWWCQDWVPRLNICLLVVRSLFLVRLKQATKQLWELNVLTLLQSNWPKTTIGRKLECQQEILWSKFRNKRLMSWWWCLCRISDFAKQ